MQLYDVERDTDGVRACYRALASHDYAGFAVSQLEERRAAGPREEAEVLRVGLARDRQPGLLDRAEGTDGQKVVAAEIGLGWPILQQPLHFGAPGVESLERDRREHE